MAGSNWTGFYIFGGGGGGLWSANGGVDNTATGVLHHLHQHPDGRRRLVRHGGCWL